MHFRVFQPSEEKFRLDQTTCLFWTEFLLPDDWMTQTWLALKPELRYGHCPAQTYKDNEPEEGHGHSGRRGRWTMASCRQLLSPTFWPSAGPWIWFGRVGQTSRQSTCPEPLVLWREILMMNVPLSCPKKYLAECSRWIWSRIHHPCCVGNSPRRWLRKSDMVY